MSDPLRTDAPRPVDRNSEVGREEKIEELLLTGLEHYFANEYDQAINIWTRALFIDRGHARARAYIERARSAQAERQRESEELLQQGVAAFQRGASDEARRLLRDAMDQGAPADEALAILDRLNRLEQVTPQAATVSPAFVPALTHAEKRRSTSRAAWTALSICVVIIVGAVAFAAGAFRASLAPLLVRPIPPTVALKTLDDPPALPRRGENALVRARTLAQVGRLREALTVLDDVRTTDTERADADRLRADLQKQLIAMSAGTSTTSTRTSAP